MKGNKFFALLLPAALMLGACSKNDTTATLDTTGSGQLSGVSADLFDLPSSVASSDASVEMEGTSLAKVASTEIDSGIEKGLEAYRVVPMYIQFADEVKDSVRALIENIAAADLPENYDGEWDGLQVKIRSADSLFDGETGKAMYLSMKKEGITVMNLHYIKNARSQYRGACYYKSQEADSTALLMRFNSFNAGVLGKRMTLWVKRPNSVLEDAGDPSVLRVRAVSAPSGRIMVTGLSYHPNFASDDFWTEGAKVYGFRIVANPEKEHAILRIAFANAADITDSARFFEDFSMDKSVAKRGAELWKASMETDPQIASLVYYSIDNNVAIEGLSDIEKVVALGYQHGHELSTFSGEDLKKYLTLNSAEVLAGDEDGKGFFFLVMVKQPIYLKANATIVGFEDQAPTEFSVKSSEVDSDKLIDEPLTDLEDAEITEEEVEADAEI